MNGEIYVCTDRGVILKSKDGVTTSEYQKLNQNHKSNPFSGFGSDYLPGGVNGMKSHADGKNYDSKSQYERAVKAKGCRIVGNDYNGKTFKRELHGDFNPAPQLKEAIHKVLGT